MVARVDAEDLTVDANGIIRRVRENSEVVDISQDGEIVARLIPAHGVSQEERDKRWADLKQFVEEIGKLDIGEVSAVDMVRDVRREL